MPTNIDYKELALLEDLAQHYIAVVALDNVSIPHQMIKAVPALVAEVRRLREEYAYAHRALIRHEQIVSGLMDKVEAWEWYEECRKCLEWLDETCCSSTPFREAEATYLAAREAIC